MPRYFFNVDDGHSSLDRDGADLPGPYEARVMAIKLAGEILKDDAERIATHETWRIEVIDESGTAVFATQVHLRTSASYR